jgi:sec-independent protein translocase protein TatA
MNILALGIGNLGGPDLFIILLIVLVLFGAKKLPDLARSLGQSLNEFRKGREDLERELHHAGTGTQPSQSQPCQAAQPVKAVPSSQQQVTSASRAW